MRVSVRYGFTFLCTTKTASTSIEHALTKHCELITRGKHATELKHINYRGYSRYIEPMIENIAGIRPETVCVMREPIDWLYSWYRYRKRDKVKKERSTREMNFQEFCELYLEGKAMLGRQSNFMKNQEGTVGVDRVFRYENLDLLRNYFEEKIGKEIEFPVMNVSPHGEMELNEDLKKRLVEYLQEDYELYNSLAGGTL